MRLIVAGSRTFQNQSLLVKHINAIRDREIAVEIVSGLAKGADLLGLQYAKERGLSYREFPALWSKYGAAAGPKRNIEMGDYADELLAFWDLKSTGTRHMIEYMVGLGKPVLIVPFKAQTLKEKLSNK